MRSARRAHQRRVARVQFHPVGCGVGRARILGLGHRGTCRRADGRHATAARDGARCDGAVCIRGRGEPQLHGCEQLAADDILSVAEGARDQGDARQLTRVARELPGGASRAGPYTASSTGLSPRRHQRSHPCGHPMHTSSVGTSFSSSHAIVAHPAASVVALATVRALVRRLGVTLALRTGKAMRRTQTQSAASRRDPWALSGHTAGTHL